LVSFWFGDDGGRTVGGAGFLLAFGGSGLPVQGAFGPGAGRISHRAVVTALLGGKAVINLRRLTLVGEEHDGQAVLVCSVALLAELKTPGFLDYFIIGEHIRRFSGSGVGAATF